MQCPYYFTTYCKLIRFLILDFWNKLKSLLCYYHVCISVSWLSQEFLPATFTNTVTLCKLNTLKHLNRIKYRFCTVWYKHTCNSKHTSFILWKKTFLSNSKHTSFILWKKTFLRRLYSAQLILYLRTFTYKSPKHSFQHL